MVGRLQMTTYEALRAYHFLARSIFSKKNQKPFFKDGMFKATTLENSVKDIVAERGLGDRMLLHSQGQDKGLAFVCAMPAKNMAHPRCFRTYPVRENTSSNCLIWEAARATTAAPTFFKSIAIGEEGHAKELFIDGGLRCNNPSDLMIEEAQALFGDNANSACLVSLGTGHKGTIGLAEPIGFQKVLPTNAVEALKRVATDCEETAHRFSRELKDSHRKFFRFSVVHGLDSVLLQEWEKMDEVEAHTKAYLQQTDVSTLIDKVVAILSQSMREEDSGINLRSLG